MKNIEQQMEIQKQQLKEQTGFDEDVIGCFQSNYRLMHVCPIATGKWCKDYVKCKNMEDAIIKEQQAKNQEISESDKDKPVKKILLVALLIFMILCGITTMFETAKLVLFGVREIIYMELVILLVLYAVISLMAAGLLYYITHREEV